ncbi:MAG: asparagine synthase (glutamine-hydrolyzing) [SAR324 cluster bacterium]|uniref:asparagine synthase (glutamine-hydrolyzing) n=1 Tax=SAR324 cluster bacterium TaxID=2024889 RepID=A0A2A4T7M6_9DELT|nr:MAG: asparagine synthase (glutamine-hydrolyzing) [SAR324 cluster bacterium]
MCGLTGLWGPEIGDERSLLGRMVDAIVHRGPDQQGIWYSETDKIGLAHRRLSIIDLSNQGAQPMFSADGRYRIAYNGEIYNFEEIREEINAHDSKIQWRGCSDTEVLLTAIQIWGLEGSVAKFAGMFAFALWDDLEKRLHLVRDRLGEKPLYYGWVKETLLFGSELSALQTHPAWIGEIDRDSLTLFLRYSYVPTPYSIYKGIKKLTPGTILTLSSSGDKEAIPVPFWDLQSVAMHGIKNPNPQTASELVKDLDLRLRRTIKRQMISDVPLGAFLSGGIDSSTIVALMQDQCDRPVKTFTIGFNEKGYDEALFAKKIASHLGTDHTELYVTPSEAQGVIHQLPATFAEPFADSSQIPMLLVSALAKQKVTVSLSGDGGDELFCGYNRYIWGNNIWNGIKHVPRGIRSLCAAGITSIPPGVWTNLANRLPLLKSRSGFGEKIHKLAALLDAKDHDTLCHRLLSLWFDPASVVLNGREPTVRYISNQKDCGIIDTTLKMMFIDMLNYMPDDILVKVDRSAMAVSLETRVPFLDHELVEFAWSIPLHWKKKDGVGKWILREVLYQYVPRKMIERPKQGFAVPIDQWLRGPLKEWAEELLSENRLIRDGFFNPTPIRKAWKEHLIGSRNRHYFLWNTLMFQSWLQHQGLSS